MLFAILAHHFLDITLADNASTEKNPQNYNECDYICF